MPKNAQKNRAGKVVNKFYCGARRLTPGWAKPTLADAIKHAERILDGEDPIASRADDGEPPEEVVIVKIVAIVKKQKAPKVVEKV